MAPFVAANPGPNAQPLLASYLFAVAIMAVLFGGIRGVFRTDWIQLAGAVSLIAMLVWAASDSDTPTTTAAHSTTATASAAEGILRLDIKTIVAVALASVTAVATQFYSILNWSTASHVHSQKQARVFRMVGLSTGLLLLIVVIVGLVFQHEGVDPYAAISRSYGSIAQQSSTVSWLVGGAVAFGLACVVCSTADSVMIAITQFSYDNVLGGNSASTANDRRSLRRIRTAVLLGFVVTFCSLLAIYHRRHHLFEVLLVIATGVTVFAPACWLLVRMLREPARLAAFGRPVLWGYVGLFGLSYAIAAPLLFWSPTNVPFVGLAALVASAALTVGVWRASRRHVMLAATGSQGGAREPSL